MQDPLLYSVTLTFFAAFGLAFGSFGNVLLLRTASGENLSSRSHCPKCKHALAWYDLIPVISFLLLRRKCRHCKTSISSHYAIIEMISAALFVLSAYLFPFDLFLAFITAITLWGLLLVSVYDLRTKTIPDSFTGIVFGGAFLFTIQTGTFLDGLLGMFVMFLWFGVQWLLSRGKYVGSGDIFLGMAIGLWLGWAHTVVVLLVSYIIGGIVAVIMLANGKIKRGAYLPFGPFLAIGALLTFLGIGEWYFDFAYSMLL